MQQKQQRELDSLIKEVLKKQDRIIPIIGDDAFEGSTNNRKFPLLRWIAEKLLGEDVTDKTKETIYKDGYRGWDLMFEEYRHIYGIDETYNDFKETVVTIIEQGLEDKNVYLRKDVKDFLLAGEFEVIATTCPFHILEKEVTFKTNTKFYNVSSFAPFSARYSSNNFSKSEEELNLPAIYKIFGDCDREFVSGEDNLLKFLHFLNQSNAENGYGASPLIKYIKDKGQDKRGLALLMPIGCNNLPDWIFRFLWYPLSQDCLIGDSDITQGGVWHNYRDEIFYKFLKKYKFKTFSGPTDGLKNPDDDNEYDPVLKRITKEFTARVDKMKKYISSDLEVSSTNDGKWDLFISYAKEDVDVAKKIYNTLTTNCKKSVWMDNRIQVGEEYWDAIQYGIEHSHKFLFVITDSYLRKAREKNRKEDTGEIKPSGVYNEIELIIRHFINEKKDREKGFAIPIIIDGTKVTYTDYNGHLHDETLQSGVLEKLPKYKEYEMLQTDKLFFQIQDLVCSRESLEEELVRIFN